MAKKIWYSSPLKFFWNDLYRVQKKITPNFSDEQIFKILNYNLLNAPLVDGENIETRDLMLSGLELWKEDFNGEFLHIFFLEKRLRDFLEKTPLSDLDGIRKYLYENGKNKNVIYFKTKSQSNCVIYTFGLHIPHETNGYAFSLSLYDDNSIELYFCQGSRHGRLSDKFYADLNKKQDEKSLVFTKMFRLAINTIAYMKCFPECVLEGVPKITIDRNEARSQRSITFQLSKNITYSGNEPNSKIPHFRKGYFKLLQSDFYTNKKGEIVFVTETMVRGKAKTVSTTDKLSEK